MTKIDELSHEERQKLLQQQKTYGLVLLVTGIIALFGVAGGLWTVIGAGGAIGAGIAASIGFFIGAALLFQTVAKIEEVDILAESLHQPAFTADQIMAMAGGAEAEDEEEAEPDPYAHEDQETRRIRAEIKSGAAKYHKEGFSLMLLFKGREKGKDATPLDEMSSVKLALLYQQKQTIVKIFLTVGILLFAILTGALWTTIGPAALAVGIVVSVGFFVWAVVIYKQMKDIKEVNTLSQSFHNKGMGEEFFKEHVALPDVEELEAEPDLEQGGGNGSTKTAATIAHASEDDEPSPEAPVVVAAAAVACAVEDVPTASRSTTTSSTIPPPSSSPPHHGDEKALAAIAHNTHAMTKQKMTAPSRSSSSSAAEPKCEDEVDYERKLAVAETAIRAAEDVKQKNKNKKKADKTDAELDDELQIMKDAKKAIAAAEKARKKSIASKKTRKRVQEHEAQAQKEAEEQEQ